MILEAIKYTRLEGRPKEWSIVGHDGGLIWFGNINLIVGKNAAGKTRTLSVIREVSRLLSEGVKLTETLCSRFEYQLVFKSQDDIYKYHLKVEDRTIVEESLLFNGETRLKRSENLFYSESSEKMEEVVLDKHILSATLHDLPNYSYLKSLYEWGKTLQDGKFTNQSEKVFLVKELSQLESEVDNTTSANTIAFLQAFWKGKNLFGDDFINKVKEDMLTLQYPIDTIDILEGASGYGVYVKENELDDLTSQLEMSQGMFRTLSFIVRLNMALMSNISICVLIDDLGEGLDFDRSKLLIDLLVGKINDSNIQIFITTNDRYIMNKVPLECWSVVRRFPKKTIFYNYYNSKDIFEDFEFTGLNNFDFLTTDFYLKGFGDID